MSEAKRNSIVAAHTRATRTAKFKLSISIRLESIESTLRAKLIWHRHSKIHTVSCVVYAMNRDIFVLVYIMLWVCGYATNTFICRMSSIQFSRHTHCTYRMWSGGSRIPEHTSIPEPALHQHSIHSPRTYIYFNVLYSTYYYIPVWIWQLSTVDRHWRHWHCFPPFHMLTHCVFGLKYRSRRT